ncbi:MAG: type VI secretion system tube protein TssD [Myxococcota bacterium]
MSRPVYVQLTANGNNIIGEPTHFGPNNEYADMIECYKFSEGSRAAIDRRTGRMHGDLQYDEIAVWKEVCKASPLIQKAMTHNELIEGKFLFSRATYSGDGTYEQYWTVTIGGGRVASIERTSPDCREPGTANNEMWERVGFVFENITWSHNVGSTEHTDSWSSRA